MQKLWQKAHPSVISLTFLNTAGERLTSGTGFKAAGYLVTNNHVIEVPSARQIIVRTVGVDGSTRAFEANFGHLHFRSMLKSGQEETRWDYAVLDIDHPDFATIPDLQLKDDDDLSIGSEVGFMGFQFEQPNLAIHCGLIASTYTKAGVRYIQVDGSVNHGNSGGPLIDPADGKVLGIVTRKATGLTKEFQALDAVLESNIHLLNQCAGNVFLSGLDPIATTREVQEQLRIIAHNIGRSANVGIGYAYHVSEVRTALAHLASVA